MYNFGSNYYGAGVGGPSMMYGFGTGMIFLMLWSLLWKGLALWHAGRRGQEWWFVALLLINTAGILEIIYLFAILKLRFSKLFSK